MGEDYNSTYHLLAEQPGNRDVKVFIAAGRNANGTVVVYSPLGEPVIISAEVNVTGPLSIVNPRTGESVKAAVSVGNRIDFPDTRDWLAVCGKEW